MATQVIKEEKFELDNGDTVIVRPLKIKKLREFMKIIDDLPSAEDNDAGLDVLVKAASLAVRASNPDLPEDFDVEDEFNLNDVNRILELAGGIDLSGGSNLTRPV